MARPNLDLYPFVSLPSRKAGAVGHLLLLAITWNWLVEPQASRPSQTFNDDKVALTLTFYPSLSYRTHAQSSLLGWILVDILHYCILYRPTDDWDVSAASASGVLNNQRTELGRVRIQNLDPTLGGNAPAGNLSSSVFPSNDTTASGTATLDPSLNLTRTSSSSSSDVSTPEDAVGRTPLLTQLRPQNSFISQVDLVELILNYLQGQVWSQRSAQSISLSVDAGSGTQVGPDPARPGSPRMIVNYAQTDLFFPAPFGLTFGSTWEWVARCLLNQLADWLQMGLGRTFNADCMFVNQDGPPVPWLRVYVQGAGQVVPFAGTLRLLPPPATAGLGANRTVARGGDVTEV